MQKIVLISKEYQDVGELMNKQTALEKGANRQYFLKIVSSIRFLAKRNIAFQNEPTNSNFLELMKLRGEDCPKILEWLQKKKDKYIHYEIQNEILEIMAHQNLRKLIEEIKSARFFSVMVDEAADISNLEQAVFMIRTVNESFEANEIFLGLYQVESITSDSIFNMIKDALMRFDLGCGDNPFAFVNTSFIFATGGPCLALILVLNKTAQCKSYFII